MIDSTVIPKTEFSFNYSFAAITSFEDPSLKLVHRLGWADIIQSNSGSSFTCYLVEMFVDEIDHPFQVLERL